MDALEAYLPQQYWPYIAALVTVCAGVATIMPPPGATGVTATPAYGAVYKAINWVAFNFGHAKNGSGP